MSGGRLNYLAGAFLTNRQRDYEELEEFLREHAPDTAAHECVQCVLRHMHELEAYHFALYDVIHAAEWAMSGDTSVDEAAKVAREWTLRLHTERRTR